MLINFFLFLVVLFLFSGLALDAGMLQLRRLQLQHAADAAALGAVYERARGLSDWVAAGKADAAMNGFTDGANGVTIGIVSPPTSGNYSGNATAIQATVTQSYHTAFMGLISASGNATPGTAAVAAGSTPCVYVMGSGSSSYPFINTYYSGFYPACSMYVDSTNESIENDAGSTLTVSGGNKILVQASASNALLSGPTSPYPTFNFPNQNDPLAYETAPVFSSCTYVNKSVSSNTTLSAGTYCGGITISAATVTFNPGLYIVTGGMTWKNGSTINGTGVTFYLTTGGGSTYGAFNILNSTVTLSAPTSASGYGLVGIVVFGDRNWNAQGTQGIQIISSYVTTNGIWYVPTTGVYNYVSTLCGTTYLGLVTDNIRTYASTFTFPTPDYSSLTGGSPYHDFAGSLVQ